MEITKITKDNERAFLPFCARGAAKGAPDLIRIGAVMDNRAQGALSARINDGIADITSLYILPEARRQGFGKALTGKLEEFMADSECDTICAAYQESTDLDLFFDSLGYVLFPGEEVYYFTLGELMRSEMWKKHISGRSTKGLTQIASLPPGKRKAHDIKTGFRDYDPEWSTVCMDGEEFTSSLLAVNSAECVSIVWMNSDTEDPSVILQHLKSLVDKTVAVYPGRNDIKYRMIFEDEELSGKLETLLGGRGYLHSEGRIINALKFT